MTPAPAATIVVPTHNHSHLIGYALRSIQDQTVANFELFVIGDGAPPATRDLVQAMASSDPRIRYFDFPKGERHGEANRHLAMQHARGQIVTYCGDDDLWLSNHLATLEHLLGDADFANTVQIEVAPAGTLKACLGDLAHPPTRKLVQKRGYGFFGLTEAGHTLAAYRRMEGWSPAPKDIATDQHMFCKFFALPWVRCASSPEASALHFPSPLRTQCSDEERTTELRQFSERLHTTELRSELRIAILEARLTTLEKRVDRMTLRSLQREWRRFRARISGSDRKP